ncbi:MAG: triose-phosphate isomerase, partial [Acholeplasmataceae bacterium]
PEQANETIEAIREVMKSLYGDKISNQLRILYGGSVNPKNIDSLIAMPHIDGALVGGASLDPNSFLTLAKAALKK